MNFHFSLSEEDETSFTLKVTKRSRYSEIIFMWTSENRLSSFIVMNIVNNVFADVAIDAYKS